MTFQLGPAKWHISLSEFKDLTHSSLIADDNDDGPDDHSLKTDVPQGELAAVIEEKQSSTYGKRPLTASPGSSKNG
jgi:hypothetical protein